MKSMPVAYSFLCLRIFNNVFYDLIKKNLARRPMHQ